MGEQSGHSLSGSLSYVEKAEFERILSFPDRFHRAELFATLSRINTLYMISSAGSGHVGSSFSSLDFLSWLHLEVLTKNDIFFSSKGHDAPGYYAVMLGLGLLSYNQLHQLRKSQGLPGHPDIQIPIFATNTGSLGMGISKAKGMLYARNLTGKSGKIFVLMGDGELQEGQVWESLISAANSQLDNLIVIIDHNKLQSDNYISLTSDLGDLEKKFSAFGWEVARGSGHNFKDLTEMFEKLNYSNKCPKVLILDTIKGCGVSFMEHTSFDSDVETYRFHSGAPEATAYLNALNELISHANSSLLRLKAPLLKITEIPAPQVKQPSQTQPQRLINAYSNALISAAHDNLNLVALDADLILDTGLIPFQKNFPNRFIECGIAEQDMVSQAGGMALQGLLPVVHSFACFLSSRPNEQIYNNATERTRIVYVGSLAGLTPGGPGHSHQAVRDIASLSGIPNFTMLEPSCEDEVGIALNYCLNQAPGSSYLRLISVPCEIPYKLPKNYQLIPGKGIVLMEGQDVVLISYGPVLLTEAWHAQTRLLSKGISVKLINLPWLNQVDVNWIKDEIGATEYLVTLDNHQVSGGQGQMIAATLASAGTNLKILQLGVNSIPQYGRNDEVLRAHGLDSLGIEQAILNLVHTHTPKNNTLKSHTLVNTSYA